MVGGGHGDASGLISPNEVFGDIRPEAPGERAKDWIPNLVIIGNCRLGKVQVREIRAYNKIFNFGAPTPKEAVVKVFEPKLVYSLFLPCWL